MTRPLDLMVDVDDVIIPTMLSIHNIAQERGLHDGTAQMRWSGWESYGCEPDDYWDCWSHFAASGGYVNTAPIEGAVEALRWLMWEGHAIHIVTARGFMAHADDIRAWTVQWLEEFAVPHKTLTFARDKVAAQEELGVVFDAGIDDSPKNFKALNQAGVQMWLQHHEHNSEETSIPRDRRIDTLWEWAFQLEKAFPALEAVG